MVIKKIISGFIPIITLFFIVSCNQDQPVSLGAGPIPGLDSSSQYLVYYGDWNEQQIRYSEAFDLIILHPQSNLSPEIVTDLKDGIDNLPGTDDDVVVVAYISLGEELPGDPIKGDGKGPVTWKDSSLVYKHQGVAGYYIDANDDDEVDLNGTWGSTYVNAGDPNWFIHLQTRKMGLNYIMETLGCDGIFMDTIDSASPWHVYAWMLEGMSDLIKNIREAYPSSIMVANRGLFYFYDSIPKMDQYNIRSYVNAVMFEAYYTGWNWEKSVGEINPWFAENHKGEAVPHVNREAKKPDGFTVICLDYLNPTQEDYQEMLENQIREVGEQTGWINCITDVLLKSGRNQLYDLANSVE